MLNPEAQLAGICHTIGRQRIGGLLSRVSTAKDALNTAHDSQWNEAYIEWCDATEELRATVIAKLGVTKGELALLVEVLS